MFNVCRALCLCAILLVAGCTGNKDGEPSETLKQARRDYNQGIAYDQSWQFRLAEVYYGKAYRTMSEEPEEDWWLYGEATFRYSHMLTNRGDIEGAMAVLGEALPKAEASAEFPAAQLSTLLTKMAYCQRKLGQLDAAKETYAKAYNARIKAVGGEGNGIFDLVVMCDCIYLSLFESGEYSEAMQWLDRADAEFTTYKQHGDSAIIKEYSGLQPLYRVRLLQATGHAAEAAAAYAAIPRHRLLTPMGSSVAAQYLMDAGRYSEAADMYATIDTAFGSFKPSHITFSVVQEHLVPRYMAMRQAGIAEGSAPAKGRSADALAEADSIVNAIDSALAWQQSNDAAELAVIYQTHEKELSLEEQKTKTSIYRILSVAAMLLLLLAAYIIMRVHRYNRQLAEKNRSLYEQIRRREQAEESGKWKVESGETLTQNQQIYNQLRELMKDPAVFADARTNHETLARLAGTNYKYVYDALHECAGMTPAEFINHYRIRHAAKLLATTNDPVGLIIEESGITSRSTFSRLFREQYSMSPTEFRAASKHQG